MLRLGLLPSDWISEPPYLSVDPASDELLAEVLWGAGAG